MKARFIAICLFAFFFSLLPCITQAGTEHNLSGYAWSSNIGWISFNCTNTSTCTGPGGANYGVNMDASGNLSGYAWSSNIGWIQFGSLAGFPSGVNTYSQNAQVVGTELRGWAKALSADGNGWDGWISLRGEAGLGSTYGPTYSGSIFSGYAWGSSVIGWILFNPQSTGACPSCGVSTAGDASLDVKSGGVSIVNNGSVPYGTVPTFEWTLTNVPTATCSVSKIAGGTPFTTINGITSSGSTVGNALTSSTLHTYQFDCTNPTISKQVSFTVAPQPAAFSLGAAETAKIQFLASGAAVSEQKNIFVYPSGGYANQVSISVTGINPAPPPGTNFTYSLGGGSFAANPPAVQLNSPYDVGTTIRVRVSKEITTPYTVTLTGTGAGAPNATKSIVVDPTRFDPTFIEF